MCQALLFVFATFFTFLLSFFFFPRCTTTINDVVLLLWLLLLLLLLHLLLLRLTSLCTSDNFKDFAVHENCFCQEFCAPNLCISNMRMNAEFDFNSLLLLTADSSIIIATVVCVRKPKNVVGTRIEKYFLTDMLMANRRSERIYALCRIHMLLFVEISSMRLSQTIPIEWQSTHIYKLNGGIRDLSLPINWRKNLHVYPNFWLFISHFVIFSCVYIIL